MPAYQPVAAAPSVEMPSQARAGAISGMQQGRQASTIATTPPAMPIFFLDNFTETPYE
jgi:hypothetical protein